MLHVPVETAEEGGHIRRERYRLLDRSEVTASRKSIPRWML
jgi:hypothetical protein